MNKKISILLFITLLNFSTVFAFSNESQEILKSFKKILELSKIDIITPTVVEVQLLNQNYNNYFGVYNQTKDRFEPYDINVADGSFSNIKPLSIKINSNSYDSSILDNNFETYAQFDLNNDGKGIVQIEYVFSEPVKSNSLSVVLDQYVSLPNLISIKADIGGQETVVVSKTRPNSNIINFPETSSNIWKFEMEYSQLLRINELELNNLNKIETPILLRFLAQPNNEYKIYSDPDSVIDQKTGERPNLGSSNDIKKINIENIKQNPLYKLSDIDKDGVSDIFDNCVNMPNSDQSDINQNNRGDVCDDFDKDGVINSQDNCINEPNIDQKDIDGDKIGDVCDNLESRFTERNPWIVWVSMSFAALLFLILLFVAIKKTRHSSVENNQFTSKESSDSDLKI